MGKFCFVLVAIRNILFINTYFCRPYDNRWSKTMVGYGPEATHFVFELTYNYGVTSYEMGKKILILVFSSDKFVYIK